MIKVWSDVQQLHYWQLFTVCVSDRISKIG